MTLETLRDAHARVTASDAAGAWLKATRARAWQQFAEHGFPSQRHEDWKYTNLKAFADRTAAYLATASPAASDSAGPLPHVAGLVEDALRVVIHNGRVIQLPEPGNGLRIARLADSEAAQREHIARRLADEEVDAGSSLAALNAAFLTDAIAIEIAAGTSLNRPLLIAFVADGNPVSVQTRVLLTLGERSEATLIEQFVSTGPAATNTVTQVECGAGARLRYLKLQDESPEAHHIAAQRLQVARDARIEALHIDLGARLARNDLNLNLLAPGAEATMHGLFVGDGQRHVDNHTRVDHRAPHTHSVASYRGVMSDQARGVFNGKILVHDGADGTDASLENRNLLLSQQAEIDTKPELEIYADDVKCSHGATTGQLDPAAIFYLRSRGVAEPDARRMLTLAFAAEITHRIPLPALRDYIEQECGARIDADQAEEQFA